MNKSFLAILLAISAFFPALASAKTMSTEAEAVVVPSIEPAAVSAAPQIKAFATGRDGQVRVAVEPAGSPQGLLFAVRESVTGRYVNPASGELVESAVWTGIEAWNGEAGVVVAVGSVGSPAFAALAKSGFNQIARSPDAQVSGYFRASRGLVSTLVETATFVLVVLLLLVILRNEFWGKGAKSARKRR
jgi:hypothetical protein